ncbi:S8 family serine peptidase [Undibacterium rugosum]|uniref:S8 family serine peptidase n=1 Tax=Undibacterium rugosum TaxID=2762291 RepID=UPI001B8381CA|nr:S8 family serine peptidase [Undibacterium rugosum]MBR7780251.1 S8 family serine peptidase [Undibacterium rugosum]
MHIEALDTQKEQLETLTGVVLYENRLYDLPDLFPLELFEGMGSAELATGLNKFSFIVVDPDDQPIPHVTVVCQTSSKDSQTFTTDQQGGVTIELAIASIPVLLIRPEKNFWSTKILGRGPSDVPHRIILTPVELVACEKFSDLLGTPTVQDGGGVVVAIVDTGISNHKNLVNVTKRVAVVDAEVMFDDLPDGIDHGTHVAGIIGSNHPECLGQAPGAEIHSYRVCAPNSRNMTTLDVVVAITEAVESGADIINLSLGFSSDDSAIVEALEFALASGVLVVAASGNNGREIASFPARMENVVSVSAIGKIDAYPPDSEAAMTKAKEIADNYFVGNFCNSGESQIQCSAPGVGVVSTVRRDGFLPRTGTSMAAPMISGLSATILSRNRGLLGARSPDRAQKLRAMLYNECRQYGLAPANVGHGIPLVR